jgi:peroxiredoxin
MTNGYRYALLLLWEQQIKQDKQIGNTWLMNGTIFEIHAKKLGHMPFIRPYSERKEQELTATIKYAPDSSSPQTYEELLAKVRQTCQIYQRETTEGKTAAVVILHKMCDGYPNTLTREQYNALINILHPFTESAVGQKHKEMFGYTCYTLYKKSEHYQDEGGEVKSRPAMIVSSSVTTSQLKKLVTHNGLVVNESSDLQLVNCQISGTAPDDADSISVRRCVSHSEVFGRFPVKNGRFSFTCQLPKDEVCYLLLDNRSMTYFWVDGQPIKADLKHGSVKSSKASQLRNNFVNETEAERVRMLKIKNRAELDTAINRQCERYRQVIFSGKDDLMRTYALYKFYSELTYDELKPFVSNKFRYVNHLLMAPVKEYVAGLEKRFPGKHYENVLLVDTLGNYHELKEYVGKGYVVLHFWESWHHDQFDILPQLRILYEKYHKTKNVEIISLATDAINNPNSKWSERLKEEQLPWPQLATKAAWNLYGICSWPETIVIDPDGTIIASPRNVKELENVLETLNPNRSLD